ncbi:MAG: thioredoxin [Candidatus Pacearchaeota archaeon]
MVSTNYTEMEINAEEFKKIINNSSKVVVADFYAEWCMPCLIMTPILEDLAEEMKDIKFVKINIEDNQELSSRYGVSSVPCLIVFKQGKELGRIIGSHSFETIKNKINSFLKEN